MGFELSNIKKLQLQNGSNNIHLTTFVPASERFRRVHNAFWTKRWLGWPRCMANACIPPASTIAGLLLEQTDRTETKWYYKHYAGTKLYNTDFSNQYIQHTAFKKTITFPKAAYFQNIYYHTPFQDMLNNTDNGTKFTAKKCHVHHFWTCVTVKFGFYIPQPLCMFLSVLSKTSARTLNFPWTYICAYYPVPWLHVQKEHQLAWYCCFKNVQLEIWGGVHNFLAPLLSLSSTEHSAIIWRSYWHWSIPLWQWGPNQYG